MGKKKRRSASVKEEVVLRLLRGEDLELVSREIGFALHELTAWRERYLRGGREALKSHPGDPANTELDEAKKLIANQALEIEILKKARAIAVGRKP
jgi:transposase-like protein